MYKSIQKKNIRQVTKDTGSKIKCFLFHVGTEILCRLYMIFCEKSIC